MIRHCGYTWGDTSSSLYILPSVCTVSHDSAKSTKRHWTAHIKILGTILIWRCSHGQRIRRLQVLEVIGSVWAGGAEYSRGSVSRRAKRPQRSARRVPSALLRRLHPHLSLRSSCELHLKFTSASRALPKLQLRCSAISSPSDLSYRNSYASEDTCKSIMDAVLYFCHRLGT